MHILGDVSMKKLKDLKLQYKGTGSLSPKNVSFGWKDTTTEFILEHAALLQKILKLTRGPEFDTSFLDENRLVEQLENGFIVNMNMMIVRAVLGSETCPTCGATAESLTSLSRRDNETMICENCGMREAFEDM